MTFELVEVSSNVPEAVSGVAAHFAPEVTPPDPTRNRGRPRVQPVPRDTPAPTPPFQVPLTASSVDSYAASESPSIGSTQQPLVATNPSLVAPAVPTQAPPPAPRSPMGFSSEKEAYYRLLRATVEQHRTYPRSARRARLQGTVVVRMSVTRAGRLVAARVSRSSGEAVLDDAALSAVYGAGSLPVAPAMFEREPVTLEIPFVFRLQ